LCVGLIEQAFKRIESYLPKSRCGFQSATCSVRNPHRLAGHVNKREPAAVTKIASDSGDRRQWRWNYRSTV